MLGSTITVTSSQNDLVNANDFLFLRNAFDYDRVYYDMHHVAKHSDSGSESTQEVATKLQQLQRWRMKTEPWIVHDVIAHKEVYVTSAAVVIRRGMLVYSEDPYVYTNEPMVIRGRFNMFRLPLDPQTRKKFNIIIALHQDPKKDPQMSDGVLCIFGADGYLKITSRVERSGKFEPISAVKSGSGESGCFSFEIIELEGKRVTVNTQYAPTCEHVSIYEPFPTLNSTLTLDLKGTFFQGKYVVIYAANEEGYTAIESFKVN